jgi:hypothetical protein
LIRKKKRKKNRKKIRRKNNNKPRLSHINSKFSAEKKPNQKNDIR